MIKSKRWVLLFLLILAAGLGAYMGVCYLANPLGYFTNERGLELFYMDDYTRKIKMTWQYEHSDEYDAAILGGSKSGAIDTALMEEYTGLRYYNQYMNVGNFSDYLTYSRFLAEKCDIKELTLMLGCFETTVYDRSMVANNTRVPAIVRGGLFSRITEKLSYLVTDLSTMRKALTTRAAKNPLYTVNVYDGMRNRAKNTRSFEKNPKRTIKKSVLKKLDWKLNKLFSDPPYASEGGYREENLAALRQIVDLCKENDVRLRVVFGASFLSDKYLYECDEYYDYVTRIVQMCGEVWDFSDYNEINQNPYNFYDYKHYSREVADLMIRTMFGDASYEGFGRLLTPDNVEEAMKARKEQYLARKAEYEKTGKVTLYDMDHRSFIPRSSVWRTPGMDRIRDEAWNKAMAGETVFETEDDTEDGAE